MRLVTLTAPVPVPLKSMFVVSARPRFNAPPLAELLMKAGSTPPELTPNVRLVPAPAAMVTAPAPASNVNWLSRKLGVPELSVAVMVPAFWNTMP